MMDCSAAEGMVTRYINHTLSIDELEDFLEHVESCSSCYDELETYFIVHEAMLQLNEDEEDAALDLRYLLEQDIRKSRHYIYKKRAGRAISVLLLMTLIVAVIMFIVFVVMQLFAFL